MAKVVCILYPDPVDGYPKTYARDDIPKIERYPDGMTTPTPSAIDFKPGELLGSVSGELGLRKFLEKAGHPLVVTSDKDGKDSRFDKELPDAEVIISQPFWPAYMTKEDQQIRRESLQHCDRRHRPQSRGTLILNYTVVIAAKLAKLL